MGNAIPVVEVWTVNKTFIDRRKENKGGFLYQDQKDIPYFGFFFLILYNKFITSYSPGEIGFMHISVLISHNLFSYTL